MARKKTRRSHRRTEVSGILDFFKRLARKREESPQETALPAELPEQQPVYPVSFLAPPPPPPAPAIVERMLRIFQPPPAPPFPAIMAPLPAEVPKEMIPAPVSPEIPTAPLVPEEEILDVAEVWERMVPPAPPAPAPAPASLYPVEEYLPSAAYLDLPFEREAAEYRRQVMEAMERQPPAWILYPPSPPGPWTIPSREEMARLLLERIPNLQEVLRDLERFRTTEEFALALAEHQRRGQPFMVALAPIAYRELYTDFSAFFGIPWEIFQSYVGGARTEAEYMEAERRFWEEVLNPTFFRVTEAMDLIKPRSLPGYFTVARDPSTGGYWLYYAEALTVPVPRPTLLSYRGA
jgi:hypothetical protein